MHSTRSPRLLIVSTQDLHEADALATSIVVLREGRVVAHGSTAPFCTGPVVAAAVAVAIQAAVTIAGACVVGFRPTSWAGTCGMALVILALSLGIALLSIAVAIRTTSASTTGLVALVVFGLSFFTGFFAPVDELSPWMRVAATVNPLSYVIDAARQLESGSALTAMPVALAGLGMLMLAGIAACTLASNHARRNR